LNASIKAHERGKKSNSTLCRTATVLATSSLIGPLPPALYQFV
jgi:hypothetical protein